jgi:hypothetical protein
MIVVLGRPEVAVAPAQGHGATLGSGLVLDGPAAGIALAIARAGVHVELVGSIGDDPEGDAAALALGQAGVGHAALLRDPGSRTRGRSADGELPASAGPLPRIDADDIGLGLRYVPACDALVIATPLDERAWAAAMEGAAYHGASVIAVVGSAGEVTDALAGAIVLLAPDPEEPDGPEPDADPSAFESFVAACAVRIARGVAPEVALAEAVTAGSWEPRGD